MLYAEEDPEARQATRNTVVSPTRTTLKALAIRNMQDPAQDFRGILKTMATQTLQIVQPGIPKLPPFSRTTPATPYQKRVYDMLQRSLR
jgi:hypothetical protein